MVTERQFRLARKWSNDQLRLFGCLFTGAVVNVSGWRDEDKQGGKYSDYFPAKLSYTITNCDGECGFQNNKGELKLDLTDDLPAELRGAFDVVFNHTTLEHIYDFQKAFKNICDLSRDVAILVVPFSQTEHYVSDFGDYWRFAPMAMRRMFQANGMEVLYEAANNHANAAVYLFYVASKQPNNWQGKIPRTLCSKPVGGKIGTTAGIARLLEKFLPD